MAFVEVKHVKKIYKMGEVVINAVDDMNFSIEKGEFVVIVGPSGAGKTTVLNILGGMDQATEGQVLVDGVDVAAFVRKKMKIMVGMPRKLMFPKASKLSGKPEIGWPSVYAWLIPDSRKPVPNVQIKSGTPP